MIDWTLLKVKKHKPHKVVFNWILNFQNNILIYSNFSMKAKHNGEGDKRRYSYISIKKRQTLVKQVLEQGKCLSKVSKKLNIRLSTAKLILRKYKLHGKFFMKKTHFRKRNRINIVEDSESSENRKKNIVVETQVNSGSLEAKSTDKGQNMVEWVIPTTSFAFYYVVPQNWMEEWAYWSYINRVNIE